MRNGPTKKLDFEKAKSRAKTQNADYRERFAEEGNCFDRGGSHGNPIHLGDSIRAISQKILRDDISRALKFYERHLKSHLVFVGKWKFHFRFTPLQFASENGISIKEANQQFPTAKNDAIERLRMTMQRARIGQLESYEQIDPKTQKMRIGVRLRFRTFLPTIEEIQWQKVFKLIHICPQNDELPG
jgi:hypothetical protein